MNGFVQWNVRVFVCWERCKVLFDQRVGSVRTPFTLDASGTSSHALRENKWEYLDRTEWIFYVNETFY